MHWNPATRYSLLLRLQDRDDALAWEEFVAIYEPVLYRLIRRRGVQHADAQELTQEAMLGIARAIERWDPDPGRGSFRGWLFRIARNKTINFLARRRPEHQGGGGTDFQQLLQRQPDAALDAATVFEAEYQQEVFGWAARQVRSEFRPSTWDAFWRSAVDGESVQEVGAALGMSVGAVYMARSRVVARIKSRVAELEQGLEDR